jgi:N-methylhydantoinase A
MKAAAGVIEIINVNMMGAVRVISVEQGEDPRDFTLVAFGGAGPLHAADVARSMGMRQVLVPPRPGLLSAIGLIHADVRGDFSLTTLMRAESTNIKSLNRALATLKKRGAAWIKAEGERRSIFQWLADFRYVGQNSELIMELDGVAFDSRILSRLTESFHHRHKDAYGYDMRGQGVEIVNLRLVVTAARRNPPHERVRVVRGTTARDASIERRKAWFAESGFVSTPVYDRDRLTPGCRISGPAIIEQMDTTTVVPPRAVVHTDKLGYLHMELAPLAQKRTRQWAQL